MENMKPLRVVQVGTEHDHASAMHYSLESLHGLYDLIGVVPENEECAKRAAELYGAKQLITWEKAVALKPDAILIETEELSLVPNAIRALEAGFHVYMDKPGSEDCAEFHRMCDLAKQKNLVLCLGYMYRYNPAVQHALQLKNEGKLGEIFSVEAQMSVRHQNDKRAWLGRFQGGMMYFLGCHLIDLVVQFCGFPEKVYPFNMNTGIDGNTSLDFGFAVLQYHNGVSFVKTCASEINGYIRRQLVVNGSLGSIEIKPIEMNVGDGSLRVETRETLNNDHAWAEGSTPVYFPDFKRYTAMFEEFAQYVRGVKENPYTYDYEAKLHDLIMEICR